MRAAREYGALRDHDRSTYFKQGVWGRREGGEERARHVANWEHWYVCFRERPEDDSWGWRVGQESGEVGQGFVEHPTLWVGLP